MSVIEKRLYELLTICSDLSAFALMSIIFANNCWIACWASSSAWQQNQPKNVTAQNECFSYNLLSE